MSVCPYLRTPACGLLPHIFFRAGRVLASIGWPRALTCPLFSIKTLTLPKRLPCNGPVPTRLVARVFLPSSSTGHYTAHDAHPAANPSLRIRALGLLAAQRMAHRDLRHRRMFLSRVRLRARKQQRAELLRSPKGQRRKRLRLRRQLHALCDRTNLSRAQGLFVGGVSSGHLRRPRVQ